jgi:hypothetical protein
MDPEDLEAERLALMQQVKGSFSGSSLTLLSIIQAGALAELASVVAGNYSRFNIVQWLMAAVTFLLLVVVWDHLSRDAITFSWIPDFRDSALPFIIGAVELYMGFAVGVGIDAWMIGTVGLALAALAHLSYVRYRAEQAAESRRMRAYARERWRVERGLTIAGMILCPLLAAASKSGLFGVGENVSRGQMALAICGVLLVGLWLAGYVLSTHVSWRATIERTGLDRLLE